MHSDYKTSVTNIVKNPETLKDESNPEAIKKVSVKYVKNLLTNRDPHPDYSEDIRIKKLLHNERMKEDVEDDEPVLTRRRFEAT